MSTPPLTRRFAEFINHTAASAIKPAARDAAVTSLVDTVGVTIAGSRDPAVQLLARTFGEPVPSGPSTRFFDDTRSDPMTAAMLNATAAHALDFDDVSDTVYGHPSAVLWPSLLAVGEEIGAPGERLVEAFVIGFQVQCSVAAGLQVKEHYGRGWHASATLGVVGAVAALCRLKGLDPVRTRWALGLGASMASGSRQNFGSMAKPLQVGLAARNAVLATALAQNGFTSDPDQLESPLGYFAQFSDSPALESAETMLEGPFALAEHGLNVKRHACCYFAHRAADAALELRQRIRAIDVRRIDVTVQPGGLDALIHHRPANGREGQFSIEYVVAAALLDGHVGVSAFSDAAVTRASVQQLLTKVAPMEASCPPVGPSEWTEAFAVVSVESADGESVSRVDVPHGNAKDPLAREELETKFRDCVESSPIPWQADRLLKEIYAIGACEKFTGFTASSSQLEPAK